MYFIFIKFIPTQNKNKENKKKQIIILLLINVNLQYIFTSCIKCVLNIYGDFMRVII
jgi:hypothetical protein